MNLKICLRSEQFIECSWSNAAIIHCMGEEHPRNNLDDTGSVKDCVTASRNIFLEPAQLNHD